MGTTGRPALRWLSAALMLLTLIGATRADVDERLKPLLEEMRTFLETPRPVFLRQRIDIAVDGAVQGPRLQEVWVRDLQHLRVEQSDGTVVVMTPEGIRMYVGPATVLVDIPQATLEALGDERDEALRTLDISPPADNLQLIVDGAEHLQVTGEETIEDEECWVVAVGEPLLPGLRHTFASIPAEFDLKTVQLAIGRDTGVSRYSFYEFTGPAQLEIGITLEEFEEDAEVPDERLVFEAPEEALVLTWTPDKTPEQMRQERDEAIAARMK
jgi:hypothetical protein